MKKQKVNLSQLNQMKQQFQNLASDTDMVTFRANGRSYQFNKDGTAIVVEGLKQVNFDLQIFLEDFNSFVDAVENCTGFVINRLLQI